VLGFQFCNCEDTTEVEYSVSSSTSVESAINQSLPESAALVDGDANHTREALTRDASEHESVRISTVLL
jgi:hypothetical protein